MQVRSIWNELEYNKRMRYILEVQRMRARHIRECDVPGPADLLVYRDNMIVCWLELKIMDADFEPSQPSFLLDHWPHARVGRLWAVGNNEMDHITISMPIKCDDKFLKEEVMHTILLKDYRNVDWLRILTS